MKRGGIASNVAKLPELVRLNLTSARSQLLLSPFRGKADIGRTFPNVCF
jgi:hypothetical protein